MNPLDMIQINFQNFTKTEENIAVYILNNPKDFSRSPIESSVQITGTSKPAMIRFAKKIGYNGYNELRYDLSRFLVSASYNPEGSNTSESTIHKITQKYCEYIEQLNETLDINKIQELANMILTSRKTKIFAINRTALGAHQLQLRALKIGVDIAAVVTDTVAMYDVSNVLSSEDLCIIFSIKDNGGHYPIHVDSLKSRGCKIALVTMNPQLTFAKKCDIVIPLPPVSRGYGEFIDEQAIYFVFVEILLNELATLANK